LQPQQKLKKQLRKTDKKVIKAPLLADKVKRYADLKQIIDSATGELKMIEGDIKGIGKKLFMSEYKTTTQYTR
jgi:hypothetical protein